MTKNTKQLPEGEPIPEGMSRRQFVARVAKAGAVMAAAGSLSYLLYDPKGPEGGHKKSEVVLDSLPDYSVKGVGSRMAMARGEDRSATLVTALTALGGIETFIKSGDRVLLKVNAAFASPAILSATTNPQLIMKVVELCTKAGAAEVRISDNPINDPESCFRLSGISEAAEKTGAAIFLPRENAFKPFTLRGGSLIARWPLLFTPLSGVDKVIGISPVKDHHRAGASMSMKNWYGLLGGRRNIFHQDVNTIVTELAMMMKPTLVILDGTMTMMTNGPTGGSTADLKATNTMIVSTDQVAADAFGSTLLDRTPADLPYIARAAAAGCGVADYKTLKPGLV